MNLSQEIKKAECKLIKKIYKYSNLLAFGIYRHCLHNEILTLKLFIAALKGYNNPDCKVECDIKGQYSFDLPNGEKGYVEFKCNNNGYLIINNEVTTFTYDYYNNQIIYDLGVTTSEINDVNSVNFLLTLGVLVPGDSYFIYTEDDLLNPIMAGLVPSPKAGSVFGDFLIQFNQGNSLDLTITLINGNLIILNSDGSNYEGVLTFIFNDTEYLSEIISLENEIPLVYNSPIIFDECCNITGEFNFDLYCIGKVQIDLENLTTSSFAGTITIGEYVLSLTPEMLLDLNILKQVWNSQFGDNIYLDFENNELIFYSVNSLNFCEGNQDIEIIILKGDFASATATIELPLLMSGNPACTIIDLNYDQFSLPNLTHGFFYNDNFLYTWNFSEISDINDFITQFNSSNNLGLTAELFSQTELPNEKFNYQIKICSENIYPQEDFNGNTINIISYQNSQSRLKATFVYESDNWVLGTGLITIESSCDGIIFQTTNVYASFIDFITDFNANNNLGYFMDYIDDGANVYTTIYSESNSLSVGCDITITSNKSEVGFYEEIRPFKADTTSGTLSGGINSFISVIVNNFGGEFYSGTFTTLEDFINDFNNNDQGAFIELIETTDENYVLQITSPPGSAFNGTLWFINFNDDEELEFISTVSEGGANPLPDFFKDEFNENWVVNNLTNIEECKPEIINCLKPEEIEIITEKINKL